MRIEPGSPARLRTFVDQEIVRWTQVVSDAGAKPEQCIDCETGAGR